MAYKPTKFADSGELNVALVEALDIARKARLPAALGGGLAMQLYGSDRLTRDVDLVVFGNHRVVDNAVPLSFGGWRFTASNGVPIDFIQRADDFSDLYQDALAAAVKHESGVNLISKEFLAVMKMVAHRKKDLGDFAFLVTRGDFDNAKAGRMARRYLGAYGAKEFVQMVSLAEWEKSRDE